MRGTRIQNGVGSHKVLICRHDMSVLLQEAFSGAGETVGCWASKTGLCFRGIQGSSSLPGAEVWPGDSLEKLRPQVLKSTAHASLGSSSKGQKKRMKKKQKAKDCLSGPPLRAVRQCVALAVPRTPSPAPKTPRRRRRLRQRRREVQTSSTAPCRMRIEHRSNID